MSHINKYKETLQATKDKLLGMIQILDKAAALNDDQLESVSYPIWQLEQELEKYDEGELYFINELNYGMYKRIISKSSNPQ
ncbi:hypothetical protein ACSFBI_05125 [Variovorax sp. RB3P1]|uniref:hypothetical protein n=1 Tax=Variovorax sp. RB3P1 TaxID=3443732 RepID=UPI003F46F088